MSVYVVDSNFFIQAHRVYYPLDVAFSYWQKVKQLAYDHKIFSIDKVKEEIYGHNDDLEVWCKENLPKGFFKDTAKVMSEYRRISGWAVSRRDHYSPNALNEFLDADEADAFLVAYALSSEKNVIVTQEVSEPYRKNKVKIPDVCAAFDVECLNVMKMFRQLGETF